MRRMVRGMGLVLSAVVLAGCTVEGDGGSGTGDPTPLETMPTTTLLPPTEVSPQGPAEYGPAFPLTLRRTGGIAGYDDRVVLRADGRVLVDTRSVHGRVCRLDGPRLRSLMAALGPLRLGAWSSTLSPDGTDGTDGSDGSDGAGAIGSDAGADAPTDPIVIAVTDHRQRTVDLSDPSLGEVAGLVGSLVADVTLSDPATLSCS